MSQINDINNNSEEDISLGRIIRFILMQSKLIIFITLLGLITGVIYYLTSEKVYRVSSLMQVVAPQNSSIAQEQLNFDLFLGDSNTNDIDVFQNIYKSRSSLIDVIKSKNLNFRPSDNKLRELALEEFSLNEQDATFSKSYKIFFKEDSYDLESSEDSYNSLSYSTLHNLKFFSLSMGRSERYIDQTHEILIKDAKSSIASTRSKFKVNVLETGRAYVGLRSGGIVSITYDTNNPDEGMRVLDYANNNFIRKNIEEESQTARKAINFIDDRLETMQLALEEKKNKLNSFKEENRSINVNLEIEALISSLTSLQNSLNQIDIEIEEARLSFTTSNPIIRDLESRRSILNEQKSLLDSQIKNLPIAQQLYIDLAKDLETTQNLYSTLLNNKLQLSIKEASTLGNVKVIDSAYVHSLISPRFLLVPFLTILFFVFAIILAVYRGFFRMPITNPAELEDNNVFTDLVGVLPAIEDEDDEITERFQQSMESTLINIENLFARKGPKDNGYVLSITSPTSGNGKTFLSGKICQEMARLGKKVILLDNDFKRGDLHKLFKTDKITEKEFNEIDVNNLDKYKISENFYLIPKITKLLSSFQFIYSQKYLDKLEFFKSHFDVIVIDSAPLLSVSDTAVVLNYSDINLAVVRHGLTKINEIKQLLAISEQIGENFDGMMYNFYKKPASYYGYYGMYGNYNYQYYANKYLYKTYEYEDKD